MAASTADRFSISGLLVSTIPYGVKATTQIYQGIMVMLLSSQGDELVPADDTSGARVVGLSTQNVLGGATDGVVTCAVQPIGAPDGGRYWELDATSPTVEAWVGQLVYVVDDHTVALVGTTTNDIVVGLCVQVTSTATAGKVIVDTLQRA